VAMCNKVILGDKVIIKKVADGNSYKKWDDLKVDKTEEREMLKRIDDFLDKRNKPEMNEHEE
jgi:hypothetical protein